MQIESIGTEIGKEDKFVAAQGYENDAGVKQDEVKQAEVATLDKVDVVVQGTGNDAELKHAEIPQGKKSD